MPCETERATEQGAGQALPLNLPEGVPPLRSLYMYISGSCNLACRHCWIAPEFQRQSENGRHVPVEYVRKAVRDAMPLGLRSVKLTGGEPTLHPRFREIVSLLDEAGLNIVIETNGTLVDDDLAEFLKLKPRAYFVSVSLDGTTAETHDALRGVPGCFEQALAGIRALVRVGYRPQLICTLHRGNVSQVDEIVTLAESLGCGSVKFNFVQRVGRGEQFAEQQGLDVAEIIQLFQRVEGEVVPRSAVRIHFDIPFAFFPIRKLLDDSLGRCEIRCILGMLAGGELSLCGIGFTVPELIYGHIARDDLHDVWSYHPSLVRLRQQIPAELEGICGQCVHRDVCLGSCVANNYHISGRLNAPYAFCDRAEALGLFPASRKR